MNTPCFKEGEPKVCHCGKEGRPKWETLRWCFQELRRYAAKMNPEPPELNHNPKWEPKCDSIYCELCIDITNKKHGNKKGTGHKGNASSVHGAHDQNPGKLSYGRQVYEMLVRAYLFLRPPAQR